MLMMILVLAVLLPAVFLLLAVTLLVFEAVWGEVPHAARSGQPAPVAPRPENVAPSLNRQATDDRDVGLLSHA